MLEKIFIISPLPSTLTPLGPLSGTSDEEKQHKLDKDRKAFGSHDLHSHKVISNLKKVTIALEGEEEEEDDVGAEFQGDDETSLDFSSLDKPKRHQYV